MLRDLANRYAIWKDDDDKSCVLNKDVSITNIAAFFDPWTKGSDKSSDLEKISVV